MPKQAKNALAINAFDLLPGRLIARKYEIISKLGSGWEGEVYKIRELNTGIERAAKLFYPHRNPHNKTSNFFARKLHRLHHCDIIIQYHTEEQFIYKKNLVAVLISEYVEGELLSDFLNHQLHKRLEPFHALHLLHALAKGIEEIHNLGEYHGDLHMDNVIVKRYGLGFNLKIVDIFHWATPKKENLKDDICDLIRIFYDAIGGAHCYAKQPKSVKFICCGLKRSLILKKFRIITQLCNHLETMSW